MAEIAKKFLSTVFVPLLVPVLVGVISTFLTLWMSTIRLEERMATIERGVNRHETDTTKRVDRHETMLADAARRDAEQEQRLARGESFIDAMRSDLAEIKSDVKSLIKDKR